MCNWLRQRMAGYHWPLVMVDRTEEEAGTGDGGRAAGEEGSTFDIGGFMSGRRGATGDGPVRLLRSEAGEVKRTGGGGNVHRRPYDFQVGF